MSKKNGFIFKYHISVNSFYRLKWASHPDPRQGLVPYGPSRWT